MSFRSIFWFVIVLNSHFHCPGCNAENKTQSAVVEKSENPPATLNLGPTTLATIIGSIVGMFILIVVLQFAVKKFFRKKVSCTDESMRRDGEDGISVQTSIPIEHSLPPSYDEIHLYKQLNVTFYTPVYYNIPGTKVLYGIAFNKDDQTKDFPDMDPPPYELDNAEEII